MTSGTSVVHVGDQLSITRLVGDAKYAYTTRTADLGRAAGLLARPDTRPESGDVIIARVDAVGQHKKLELATGRRATLYPGDLIGVCYGGRYAPDQFLARVPTDLGACHLVAAGGIAGRAVASYAAMDEPTQITPLGVLLDREHRRLNLRDGALAPAAIPARRPPAIAIVGSSMNAGKTTSGAQLVRGLRLAGLRVGAAKVTGTGAGGDLWLYTDSGADPAYDFTDAGVPSTFGLPSEQVRDVFRILTTQLAIDATDVNVIEVADGLHHLETATLLADPEFADRVDGVVFAARDSLGGTAGVDWLRRAGLPVLSLSGRLTLSPLAMAEAARACPDVPIDPIESLQDPERAVRLRDQAIRLRDQAIRRGESAAPAHLREHAPEPVATPYAGRLA